MLLPNFWQSTIDERYFRLCPTYQLELPTQLLYLCRWALQQIWPLQPILKTQPPILRRICLAHQLDSPFLQHAISSQQEWVILEEHWLIAKPLFHGTHLHQGLSFNFLLTITSEILNASQLPPLLKSWRFSNCILSYTEEHCIYQSIGILACMAKQVSLKFMETNKIWYDF